MSGRGRPRKGVDLQIDDKIRNVYVSAKDASPKALTEKNTGKKYYLSLRDARKGLGEHYHPGYTVTVRRQSGKTETVIL